MKQLPENKLNAAKLIATGMMDKTDIAKEIGISRTTLWNWENTEEFKAEVDSLKQEFKTQGHNFLLGKVNATIHDIYNLGKTAESEKVRLEALKYIADQALGKASSKIELETNVMDNTSVSDDLLDIDYGDPDIINHDEIINKEEREG